MGLLSCLPNVLIEIDEFEYWFVSEKIILVLKRNIIILIWFINEIKICSFYEF